MKEPDPLQGGPESDLFWLAFRYVEGELAPKDAAQFELRLDDDQSAREAVAEAAKLALAVCLSANSAEKPMAEAAATMTPSPRANISAPQQTELSPASHDWSSSQVWNSPAVWLSFATAACVALALTIYGLRHRSDSVPAALNQSPVAQLEARPSNARHADARLADAWAAARWRMNEDEAILDASGPASEAEYALLPEDLIGELFAVDSDETAIDADWEPVDGELIISDWLLEAISAERAAASKPGHREG